MNSHSILIALILFSSCSFQMSPAEKEEYQKVQKVVSEWILEHAKYPASYKSLDYSEYSKGVIVDDGEEVENTEEYWIKHTYILNPTCPPDLKNSLILAFKKSGSPVIRQLLF